MTLTVGSNMLEAPATRPAPRPAGELVEEIRRSGPAVVALSGGVDSAAVAALAHRALGSDAVGVTLSGVAVATEEVERARRVSASLGLRHVVVPVDPLADARYRANPSNRCYFCRQVESSTMVRWASDLGPVTFLDGIHWDDLGDDRPGIRAMDEAGFRHPLLAGGWGKAETRSFARSAGLPNWDTPSDACLASRIRHGEPVSAELLQRIETAEAFVRSNGFGRVRVRVAANRARVEVDSADVPRLLANPLANEVVSRLAALGFEDVELDPAGYRPRAGA